MIEVEQKFIITPETKERLMALGAQKIATQTLHDVYHDTPLHVLMMSDCWLRRRNGRWELKYRPLAWGKEGHGEKEEKGRGEEEEEGTRRREGDEQGEMEEVRQREGREKKGKKRETQETVKLGEDAAHLPPATFDLQTCQYMEEGEEQAILALLGQRFQLQAVTMDTLLEGGALVPVVEIESVRESYILRGDGWKGGGGGGLRRGGEGREGCSRDVGRVGSGGEVGGEVGRAGCEGEVRVDLDDCPGKYGVGEVEIMVHSAGHIQPAAKRCRAIAAHLTSGEFVSIETTAGSSESSPTPQF